MHAPAGPTGNRAVHGAVFSVGGSHIDGAVERIRIGADRPQSGGTISRAANARVRQSGDQQCDRCRRHEVDASGGRRSRCCGGDTRLSLSEGRERDHGTPRRRSGRVGCNSSRGLCGRRRDRTCRGSGCDCHGEGRSLECSVARHAPGGRGQVGEPHGTAQRADGAAARRRASLLHDDRLGVPRSAASVTEINRVHRDAWRSAQDFRHAQLRAGAICALLGKPDRCVYGRRMERVRARDDRGTRSR